MKQKLCIGDEITFSRPDDSNCQLKLNLKQFCNFWLFSRTANLTDWKESLCQTADAAAAAAAAYVPFSVYGLKCIYRITHQLNIRSKRNRNTRRWIRKRERRKRKTLYTSTREHTTKMSSSSSSSTSRSSYGGGGGIVDNDNGNQKPSTDGRKDMGHNKKPFQQSYLVHTWTRLKITEGGRRFVRNYW